MNTIYCVHLMSMTWYLSLPHRDRSYENVRHWQEQVQATSPLPKPVRPVRGCARGVINRGKPVARSTGAA
jgi:hypothetical protein